jgi:PAS domain S-box-containing protein
MDKSKNRLKFTGVILFITAIIVGIASYTLVSIKTAGKNVLSVYNDRVIPLKQLKEVSDGYSKDLIDCSYKAYNGNLKWDTALVQLNRAYILANKSWDEYKSTYLTIEEEKKVKEAEVLKVKADIVYNDVKRILQKRQNTLNAELLKQIIINGLYQNVDPFSHKINELIIIQTQVANNLTFQAGHVFKNIVLLSIVMAALCLIIIVMVFHKKQLENKLIRQSNELTEANEELYATNEELQTANEELDASNEELYATNEEIEALNEQLAEANFQLEDHRKNLEQIVKERTDDFLRESRFNQSLINSSPTFFVAISPEGKTLMMNPYMLKALGYEAEEVIGKDYIVTFVPNEDRKELQKVFIQLTAELKPTHSRNRIITKFGQIIDVEWHGAFVTKGTDIDFFFGVGIDITQQNNIEESLRLSEEKFSAAFYSSPVAKSITNPEDGTFIDCNDALTKLVGYRRDELIGFSSVELGIWINTSERQKFVESLKSTGSIRNQEISYRRKDGAVIITKISGELITYNNKKHLLAVFEDITERRKAESELQQSERKYRNLHLSMMDGYVYTNMQGFIIESNQSYQDMLGYNPEELALLSYPEITPEKWHAFENDILKNQILAKGFSDVYEKEYRKKDGTIFPVELRTFLLKSESGGNEGMWAIVRDITARKKAEKELQLSEEKFSKAFTNSPIAISISRIDNGIFIECNDSFCALFGYLHSELIGKSSVDIGIWSNNSVREELIKLLKETGRIRGRHEIFKTKGGAFLQVQYSAEIIKYAGIDCMIAVMEDITEQKNAIESLRKSEEKFAKAFRSSPDIIYIASLANGRIIEVNDKVINILKYTREEVIGKTTSQLGIWADESQREQYIAKFSSDDYVRDWHVKLCNKAGVIIDTLLSSEIIELQNEKYILGTIRDITEQKKSETELKKLNETIEQRIIARTAELSLLNEELSNARLKAEAANLAKSDFLSNMSHELRTPLNAILGYAQLFQRDKSLNENQHKGIDIIHRSSEHLLQMINEVLDYAKIDAHKLELQIQPVLLIHVIKSVYDMVEIKAQIKQIAIQSYLDKELPKYVMTDEKRLSQVLLNLLNNAVKFTHRGGVTFRVKMTGNKIRFEIKDTGIGIIESKIEHIFKPFFQVGEWKDRAEGAGLGLAISQNIVRMMGGEIMVKSEVNKGSTFWFDLEIPFSGSINQLGITNVGETPKNIIGIEGVKPKILIADDKSDNVQLLVDSLKPVGFEIAIATNGAEAIKIIENFVPDIIFMDLLMPVMDGYEATKNIRNNMRFKNIPIIAVSASVGSKTKVQIVKSGFDGFLIKPIQIDDLFTTIQEKLNIQWQFDSYDILTSDHVNKGELLEIPPLEQLSDLIDAVGLQNITDIDNWLLNANALDKNYHPFVEKVKELSEKYRFDEILKLLKAK